MYTTYYLGAGASAKAIPCVTDLHDKINEVFHFILNPDTEGTIPFYHECYDSSRNQQKIYGDDIAADWQRIALIRDHFLNQLSQHLSIDTLAKVLFINNNDAKYYELKAVLMASFYYWRETKGIDNRYSNFWATLIDTSRNKIDTKSDLVNFAININIISWNYDNQLEDSLTSILLGNKIINTQMEENVAKGNITDATGIAYLKMNGSARINLGKDFNEYDYRFT